MLCLIGPIDGVVEDAPLGEDEEMPDALPVNDAPEGQVAMPAAVQVSEVPLVPYVPDVAMNVAVKCEKAMGG